MVLKLIDKLVIDREEKSSAFFKHPFERKQPLVLNNFEPRISLQHRWAISPRPRCQRKYQSPTWNMGE